MIIMKASEFIKKLSSLDLERLLEIKGIGDVLVANIHEFTSSKRYRKLITGFEMLEKNQKIVEIKSLAKKDLSGLPLFGKVVCITGTFDKSRNEIKKLLEEQGAKVVDGITTDTNLLLAGDKAGSKLEKAQTKGIEVQEDYRTLLD
jgi:DNA ligase (NAD+)